MTDTATRNRTRPVAPEDAAELALARIAADEHRHVWIDLLPPERVRAAARAAQRRLDAGEHLPLAGTTVAVKANIDIAGLRTTAGCPSFGEVAELDAPAVQALQAAGAVVVGTTNMDQFATGLTGTCSPHGATENSGWPDLVPGGSSAGSAVAVALGLVDLALGTDTAGSGRVPAALNGIVGFKPTRGRISATGVVPACRSLDCVSVFARTVELATVALAAATGVDPDDPWSRPVPAPIPVATDTDIDTSGRRRPPGPALRLGVADPATLDFAGDPDGPARHRAAVAELVAATGATLVPVDLDPFLAAGRLLYGGSFVAERYDAVGAFLETDPPGVDPVVGPLIRRAAGRRAWELARDRTELERLRRAAAPTWERVDALVVPSIPRPLTVAEARADVVAANALLGTYTNFVNLLDLAALTFPVAGAGDPNGPPPSLTLIGPAWSDEALAATASAIA